MNLLRNIYDLSVFYCRNFGNRNIKLYVGELSGDDNTLIVFAGCDQSDSLYFIPSTFEKYGFRDFTRDTTHEQPDCFVFIIRGILKEDFIFTLDGDLNFEVTTDKVPK